MNNFNISKFKLNSKLLNKKKKDISMQKEVKEKGKEEYGSIQDLINIKNICDNKVALKNGDTAKIVEVDPINFILKSSSEQIAILENYKRFLKLCNFEMQILIQTQKADISKHIKTVYNNALEDEDIKEIANDYINLIKEISEVKGSISRKFYIIIKGSSNDMDNIQKLKEGLSKCGNEVEECDNKKIMDILSTCLNKRLINIGI